MVETCYVYIKHVRYIPTPIIFIEDIPISLVVSTVQYK
jgi:hypothetical protein